MHNFELNYVKIMGVLDILNVKSSFMSQGYCASQGMNYCGY